MNRAKGYRLFECLRVLLLLSLALSMVVYWEGVVQAFPAPAPNRTYATNPGVASPNYYSPASQPQPTISTLSQQYPLIDPSYQDNGSTIVFLTSFGQYSFSKTNPFMGFSYRDGTPLVAQSLFYVNSTYRTPIMFSGYAIDTSRLDNTHITYSVNLQNAGTRVGSLQVSVVFDRVQRPKISVHVNPSATLSANGFNVLWVVRGVRAFARLREASFGMDFSNFTHVQRIAANQRSFELGSGLQLNGWRVSALIDWSDASVNATLSVGSLSLFSFVSGPVAIVTFPANMMNIDPTIVSQSGNSAYGAYQRHTFFDGTNYWAFYHNGTTTVYKHSNDSVNWTTAASPAWPYIPAATSPTAILYKSGTVYEVMGTWGPGNATLYFRMGTSGGMSINWNPIVIVDTVTGGSGTCGGGISYGELNLVVGTDGLITVGYHVQIVTGHWNKNTQECDYQYPRYLRIKKSTNSAGTSWGTPTTIWSDSYAESYAETLSPLPNGVVLGVFYDGMWGTISYALSTNWSALTQLDTGPLYSYEFGSAVTDAAYTTSLVYLYGNTIRYRSYNGTWSSPVTIASGVSTSPTISLGNGNDLYVFYIGGTAVYYVPYSVFGGWGTPSTPFGSSSTYPDYLSTESNSTSGYLFALWTDGAVKLGSLPASQVWSPYSIPSAPWDREGLVPYGHYFANLQEYVSPYSGLLTIIQSDFSIPGRGSGAVNPLTVTRVFRTPYTFSGSSPFGYENYPYANLGVGWSFNWPWLGSNYLHLSNGQGYKVTFTNNVFENHKGDQFKLLQNANGTYTLYDASANIYLFNSAKQLVSIMDPTHNNQITFSYTSNRISQITDTVGRTVSIGYDSNGRVSTVNSGGRIWTYAYNSNGDLISVKDAMGRTTSYQYYSPSNSLLYKITYPTGGLTNFTYYQSHVGTDLVTYMVANQTVYPSPSTLLRQVRYNYTSTYNKLTFWNGTAIQGYLKYIFTPTNATTITQNAQGQPIWETIDQYNSNGEISQHVVYPGGGSTSYTNYYNYDNWGNTVYQRLAITPNTYRETFSSYSNTNTQNRYVDFNGANVTTFTNSFYANSLDPNMHDRLLGQAQFQNGAGSNRIESYNQYDSTGNLLQAKDLLGSSWLTTSYLYDSYGNVLTVTDAKGNQTTYQYSPTYQNAYLTQTSNVVSGLTLSTQYAYNFTTGDRITVTSPESNVTDYRYDMIDRLTSVTWPAVGGVRAQRRTVYDDVNNIATVYDENNNYAKSYYDGLGRLTQAQAYANGTVYSTTSATYYWNDKVRASTDPTGNVTTYAYDFLGRTLTATNPDGTFVQWVFNDVASQVTVYDAKNHPTDYYYDWMNRLVTVTEHVNGQDCNTAYSYDAVGNTLQVTDSKNQVTSYIYDSLNRLTRTNFPDTTYATRTYDNVGNVVSRLTQNGTVIQYSYDQINRLTGIAYPDGATVTYVYDKDSHRLQMTDSSSTSMYTYDPRGRLLSETRSINGQLYTLGYQYDVASRLVQLTYPDGYVLHYNYDQLNRITGVGNLATLTYRKNNQLATITYGNGVQTAYSYDKLGRVTRIHTWNSTGTMLDLNYAYDPNGNPTSVNSGLETYGYDGLNRLTNATGPFGTLSYSYDQVGNRLQTVVNGTGTSYSYDSYNKLQTAGSTTYTYDNNGNTITKSTGSNSWSYSYDYENRLKQVALNGVGVLQAKYDGDGRRLETVAGSDTTIYHYLAGAWDPSYVNDLSSGVISDLVFAGIRIGKVQGGVNFYYHLDRLGSVQLVTQTSNIQPFTGKYLPYGTPYGTSGSENFQYTGKQLDVSTRLYYYGYRYYDSQSGRFMTPDLQPPRATTPQSLNRYSYALNNPMVHIDPTGGDTINTDNSGYWKLEDEFIKNFKMLSWASHNPITGKYNGEDVDLASAVAAYAKYQAALSQAQGQAEFAATYASIQARKRLGAQFSPGDFQSNYAAFQATKRLGGQPSGGPSTGKYGGLLGRWANLYSPCHIFESGQQLWANGNYWINGAQSISCPALPPMLLPTETGLVPVENPITFACNLEVEGMTIFGTLECVAGGVLMGLGELSGVSNGCPA